MRLLGKFFIVVWIVMLLTVMFAWIIQPPAEESGNTVASMAVYDATGDLTIIRYTMNQIIVTEQVRDEIEWLFASFMREVTCSEDLSHDLNIAVNLYYEMYVAMVIQVDCR